ncbi:MAG: NAD(P)-binding domain-containing protein [Anaerolineae bacterium]|jgi:ketol-acid reductoisomerase|nr:NAD(P)-binding domain-containing protein [Anaerolineae bacterium]
MTVIYHEDDGDLQVLADKVIGIIGYGSLGRPMALNLQDSGLRLQVAVNSQETHAVALADGLPPLPVEQVAKNADLLLLLLPDEVMPAVYLERISPHLTRAHTLIFASGYNVAFGYIEPPPFVDVGLVAPRTFGAAVRERYLNGQGFYSFIAAGQDASGRIWPTLLALAKALGSLRAGAVEVTMQQEVELDLFMQQAILPAVHHILTAAAGLLFKRGYPPEAAMLDLYVSGELNDYLQRATEEGLLHALRLSSLTGQFGIFSRLERFSETRLERLMELTLEEIRSQHFAREWAREYADGYPRLRKLLQHQERLDLWELEQQTIELLRGI